MSEFSDTRDCNMNWIVCGAWSILIGIVVAPGKPLKKWRPESGDLLVTNLSSRTFVPGRTLADGTACAAPEAPSVGLQRRKDPSEGAYGFAPIAVVVATSPADVAAANRLLLDRYVPKGYAVDRTSCSVAAQDAPILLARSRLDGEALATLTLRVDGPAGLLSEQIYPNEVARLRAEGCRLCEAVRFASIRSPRPIELLRRLFDLAFSLGRQLDRTDVLIEVTPRHAAFYKRMLGFEAVGLPRHNPRVNTTGTLLHANVAALADRVGHATFAGLVFLPGAEPSLDVVPPTTQPLGEGTLPIPI